MPNLIPRLLLLLLLLLLQPPCPNLLHPLEAFLGHSLHPLNHHRHLLPPPLHPLLHLPPPLHPLFHLRLNCRKRSVIRNIRKRCIFQTKRSVLHQCCIHSRVLGTPGLVSSSSMRLEFTRAVFMTTRHYSRHFPENLRAIGRYLWSRFDRRNLRQQCGDFQG